jgi:hypothetical protein
MTLSGAVAPLPGLDLAVALGYRDTLDWAWWFSGADGYEERGEVIDRLATSGRRPIPEGGVEVLCARRPLDPVLSGTATAGAGATRVAVATERAAATATAAVAQREIIESSCGTSRPFFVVSCFARDLDRTLLANEPAIVAFDGTSKIPLASVLEVGATYGLAYDLERGHLYAGAYNKRGTGFGPGGPGGIYKIDLTSGAVTTWASIAAGHDPHDMSNSFDAPAAPWVGRLSLGDIELDDRFEVLFAMNLFDGHVYRFAVPGGEFLGKFPAPLAEVGAHPFGLGFRAGWLHIGVVADKGAAPPVGHVFRVRSDGSGMEELFNFNFGYVHQPPWSSWTPIGEDIFAGYGSQPILSDIEFGPTGDILLGIRDRVGDANVSLGTGDLLPARRQGDYWIVVDSPEFYRDDNIHIEPLWGGLALAPSRDVTVATVLDPIVINSGGIAWFDNQTGAMGGRQTIYVTDQSSPTFGKAAGLGDLEGLCPNPDVPTPIPSPSPTPSPTLTPTPTATATASPTPTPTPGPIYIPVILGERCEDRTRHADVVLVLDASTSMLRLTDQNRAKLTAVQDAARLFFDQMDFTPNKEGALDQVAIVGFHGAA